MTISLAHIGQSQAIWSKGIPVDANRRDYAATLGSNLFLGALRSRTHTEFSAADGSELEDSDKRPAKMRALASSSALAVNFFDAWRDTDVTRLQNALGLAVAPVTLQFEYKPTGYPVGPRSPNLDLLVTLADERRVGIESKFAEPFRAPGADAWISPKYFPVGTGLWKTVGLGSAQTMAAHLGARWRYLDAAQLLKHMLGLASESNAPATLLYLWYDTGLEDAIAHRREVEMFADQIRNDQVAFQASTYQEVLALISERDEPVAGWFSYLVDRYFARKAV